MNKVYADMHLSKGGGRAFGDDVAATPLHPHAESTAGGQYYEAMFVVTRQKIRLTFGNFLLCATLLFHQLRNQNASVEQKLHEVDHKLRLREKELIDLQVYTIHQREMSTCVFNVHVQSTGSVEHLYINCCCFRCVERDRTLVRTTLES